ncbi:hypothetical protein QTP88_000882 [Uroleucon formosanum]
MYYFKLNENQLKKLREAHKNDTNATFQIASNKIFKGENIYYLDKIQLDKLKNAKEKKSGVRLEIRSSQIKDKKGGFLPLIFAGIGAASALVGGVTSIVNTVNDYKHKKAMEKETIRHNKEMENKELKKKDGINVSEAFEKIIKQAISQNHQAPKLLHADKGLEFENKHFKKVLQKYGIKMYHTQNEEKSSIIERFNRILNSKMRLHFEVTNSKKWIKILKSLIYEYNFKDIHRSIGMRPCEVNKSNEDVVFHKLFSTKNKPKLKIKFSVGDRVRITKKTFVKENINNNKMNKKFTYPPKTCDKCNLTVGCKNWAAHLKSIRHQKNDIDQTIVPFRFNKTYKGKPINQEKQKNYNYLKLMQNDIKKSIQKTKCYVKFCAFEYYENSESVKYTLNKIPIEGNIFIISQGDVDFGNGKPYVSKLLHSPTWLELCKIANEQIIATGDYTHHFLEDIKFIQDLGNIKMYEFYMGS